MKVKGVRLDPRGIVAGILCLFLATYQFYAPGLSETVWPWVAGGILLLIVLPPLMRWFPSSKENIRSESDVDQTEENKGFSEHGDAKKYLIIAIAMVACGSALYMANEYLTHVFPDRVSSVIGNVAPVLIVFGMALFIMVALQQKGLMR